MDASHGMMAGSGELSDWLSINEIKNNERIPRALWHYRQYCRASQGAALERDAIVLEHNNNNNSTKEL